MDQNRSPQNVGGGTVGQTGQVGQKMRVPLMEQDFCRLLTIPGAVRKCPHMSAKVRLRPYRRLSSVASHKLPQTAVQEVWGQRPHKERHPVFLLLTCLRYLLQIPLFFRKKRAIPSRSFAKLFQKASDQGTPNEACCDTPLFFAYFLFS